MATTKVRPKLRSRQTGGTRSGEAFQTVTTQATATPTGPTITLPSLHDGLTIWLGTCFDLDAHPEARINLHIDDGDGVLTTRVPWGRCITYKAAAKGRTIRIGATYLDGTGASLQLTVATCEVPTDFYDPSEWTTPVTGVVNADASYPLEWSPQTVRITLPRECEHIAINLTGEDNRYVVCFAERRSSQDPWSPVRLVIAREQRKTHVFFRYRQIAVMAMHYDTHVPIEAPPGTVLDEITPGDVLDVTSDFGTPDATVAVSNATQLSAAIAALVPGQRTKITLSAGGYGPLDIIIPNLTSDLWLCGETDNPADVAFGDLNFSVTGDTKDRKVYLSGLRIVSKGSRFVTALRCAFRAHRCKFEKGDGTGRQDVVYFDAMGQDCTFKAAWCDAIGLASDTYDVWSNGSSGGAATNANTILIGCTGSTPGNAGVGGGTNTNLLTQHVGHKMWVWGGVYTHPGPISGAGPTVAPDPDGNMWLIGVLINDGGTGNPVRYGAGGAAIKLSYGCDVADLGDAASCWEVLNSICNRYRCGGAATNYFSSNGAGPYRFEGDRWVNTGGVGYALFIAVSSYEILACEFEGFDRGWYIAGANSAASPQRIALCRDNNVGGPDVGRLTQTGVIELINNVINRTTTSSPSTTKNALCDGNITLNNGSLSSQLTSTAQRSTITPVLNSSAASATNLDADGTPQASSNLDWSTYASGLSAGNKATLLSRLGIDLGIVGVKGDLVRIDPTIVCRGPRQRNLVPSGRGLFLMER